MRIRPRRVGIPNAFFETQHSLWTLGQLSNSSLIATPAKLVPVAHTDATSASRPQPRTRSRKRAARRPPVICGSRMRASCAISRHAVETSAHVWRNSRAVTVGAASASRGRCRVVAGSNDAPRSMMWIVISGGRVEKGRQGGELTRESCRAASGRSGRQYHLRHRCRSASCPPVTEPMLCF